MRITNLLLGGLRVAIIFVVIAIALLFALVATLLPFEIRRVRPALWVIVYATRGLTFACNVRVHCTDPALLHRHEGFLFLNHVSYLESMALMSLQPIRFLAAAEIREYPIVGWMAAQLGTVFVARQSQESRRAARRAMVDILRRSAYPPLVVFPEGKLGLGDKINPFHYGIFETASQHELPYMICAVEFSHPQIAIWKGALGERIEVAVWRLATFPGPIHVTFRPLYVVHATPADDPQILAVTAQQAIADALGVQRVI